MRIRYAYKLDMEDGSTTFVVLNHIKSEEEVKELYSEKGCTQATFHQRVRTGFRLNAQGDLEETGLIGTRAQPAPATPKEPKAKKSKKSKKAVVNTDAE